MIQILCCIVCGAGGNSSFPYLYIIRFLFAILAKINDGIPGADTLWLITLQGALGCCNHYII